MKLAIVVGHNEHRQGAVRVDNGETEFQFNSKIAAIMENLAGEYGLTVKTFFRTHGGGYSKEIDRVYAEVDAWDADASMELHFNSSGDPRSTGTETLSSGTRGSMRLANYVQRTMCDTLRLRDRGVKVLRKNDRGGRSLWAGRAPAILVEPFFGSSRQGVQKIDEHGERVDLARAYLYGAKLASDV